MKMRIPLMMDILPIARDSRANGSTCHPRVTEMPVPFPSPTVMRRSKVGRITCLFHRMSQILQSPAARNLPAIQVLGITRGSNSGNPVYYHDKPNYFSKCSERNFKKEFSGKSHRYLRGADRLLIFRRIARGQHPRQPRL